MMAGFRPCLDRSSPYESEGGLAFFAYDKASENGGKTGDFTRLNFADYTVPPDVLGGICENSIPHVFYAAVPRKETTSSRRKGQYRRKWIKVLGRRRLRSERAR